MRVTLKGLVFDVRGFFLFLCHFLPFLFIYLFCLLGVRRVHQREGALHAHPQDDWGGEGVRSHRARSVIFLSCCEDWRR